MYKELHNQYCIHTYKAYCLNRRCEPKIEISSSLAASEDKILDKLVQNSSLSSAIWTVDSTTCFWYSPPLQNDNQNF